MDSSSIRRMEKSAGLAWINICTAINLSRPQLDLIQNLSLSPRARIHFFYSISPGSAFQLGWKKLLKGARLVRNDATIMLYRKHGSYDQALEDFYSLNPSHIRQVRPKTMWFLFSWQTFHRLVERNLFLFHHVCGCKKKFNMILRNCAQIFTQKQFRCLGSSCFR